MRPFSLMVITNGNWKSLSYFQFLNQVVRGGVNCIQFREKHWTSEKIQFASDIIPYFQEKKVLF